MSKCWCRHTFCTKASLPGLLKVQMWVGLSWKRISLYNVMFHLNYFCVNIWLPVCKHIDIHFHNNVLCSSCFVFQTQNIRYNYFYRALHTLLLIKEIKFYKHIMYMKNVLQIKNDCFYFTTNLDIGHDHFFP